MRAAVVFSLIHVAGIVFLATTPAFRDASPLNVVTSGAVLGLAARHL